MDPWKSWAIFGLLSGGAAFYYSQNNKSKQGRGRTSVRQADPAQRRSSGSLNDSRDARKHKGKGKISDVPERAGSDAAHTSSTPSPARSTDKVKKRKEGKQQPSKLAQSPAMNVNNERKIHHDRVNENDEEMSNKDFAEQLSGLKVGTSLKKSDATDKRNKISKKQGKNKELPLEAMDGIRAKPNGVIVQDISTASSTTGADADDDLSLPVSPDLGAAQATTPSGGDVSDMLEAPSKGPSVLHISQSASPQPLKQPKQQKAAAESETKKQRQKRQKNEERKALREQAEKERRVLLEKQLRTAREAEGRPAKNGMGASTKPAANAWNKSVGSSAGNVLSATKEPQTSDEGPLLDTFDEDKSFLGQTTVQGNSGPLNMSTEDKKIWDRELPSEEEQMRLITEMDNDNTWNTVTKGGKAKKKPETFSRSIADSSVFSNKNSASANRETLSASKDASNSKLTQVSSTPIDGVSSRQGHNEMAKGINHANNDDLDVSLANTSSNSGSDKTDTSSITSTSEKSKHEGLDPEHRSDDPEERKYYKDPARYTGDVPPSLSKRWRAIAENLNRSVWNHENIGEHPDFEPAFPFALIGHPQDSDWAANWDADDMRKANEKRARDEAAQKTEQ